MSKDTVQYSSENPFTQEEAYLIWKNEVEPKAIAIVKKYHQFSSDEQEDVVAEIRERFVEKLNDLKKFDSLQSWSYKLIVNYCNTRYRQGTHHTHDMVSFDEERHMSTSAQTPDAEYIAKCREALLPIILEELQRLDPIYQDVIQRFLLEGQLQIKIAQELGMTPSTISKRVTKGLDELRRLLRQRALHDTDFGRNWRMFYGEL